jgi:hypothetical protein
MTEDEEAALQKWFDIEMLAKGPEASIQPLAAWSTATRPDNYVTLCIGYLTETPTIQPHILRLAMTREQSSALSQTLDRLARVPHATPPDKPN